MRTLALLFVSATLFVAPLLAQDGADPLPDDPIIPTTEETKPKQAPELHKIYVPYSKLDDVFGTEKERVMVRVPNSNLVLPKRWTC